MPVWKVNLSQPKKSVQWHRLWNSLFHTSNIVSLHLGPYLKGECMNQKAKPHKQSLVIEDQNDIWVWVGAALSKRSLITTNKR